MQFTHLRETNLPSVTCDTITVETPAGDRKASLLRLIDTEDMNIVILSPSMVALVLEHVANHMPEAFKIAEIPMPNTQAKVEAETSAAIADDARTVRGAIASATVQVENVADYLRRMRETAERLERAAKDMRKGRGAIHEAIGR